MASGPIPGGGASREKQRWGNDKACSRKILNKRNDSAGVPRRQSSKQTLASAMDDEDESSPPPHASRFDGAVSDDDSSSGSGAPAGSDVIPGYTRHDNWVTLSLDSISKLEKRALKRKLVSDLDRVRRVMRRLEAKEAQFSRFRDSEDVRPVDFRLSVSVAAENRTPKVNKQFRNSGLGSGKEMSAPLESNKKFKPGNGGKKDGGAFGPEKGVSQIFKSCNNLLGKLMKHKFGWVFNAPVDVKGLGLHDYYTIVKKPMDLGTVKTRLSKNWYKSPMEFAEDVRLTFNNAMLYNPKGQDVHYMAEQLAKLFEEKWPAVEAQYRNLGRRLELNHEVDLPTPVSRRTPGLNPVPASSPVRRALVPPASEHRVLERAESMTMLANPKTKTLISDQVERPPVSNKINVEEPRKEMTFEEKRRLSEDLQSMPSEKLETIVQIIRKRNPGLSQQDDEIEVDIESVDPETLWELVSFVADHKKGLSEDKEKGELDFEQTMETGHCTVQENNELDILETSKVTESVGKNQIVSSPVRQGSQNQADSGSGSSSSSGSSSDSGSSSGSDSDSSSGYGSNTGNSPRIEIV